MAYSSGYCKGKIDAYNAVIAAIGGLGGKIGSCSDAVSSASEHTSKLIISGKSIDNGKLSSIGSNVGDISGMLSPVVAECNEKIAEWTILYREALAREAEEAESSSSGGNVAGNTTNLLN